MRILFFTFICFLPHCFLQASEKRPETGQSYKQQVSRQDVLESSQRFDQVLFKIRQRQVVAQKKPNQIVIDTSNQKERLEFTSVVSPIGPRLMEVYDKEAFQYYLLAPFDFADHRNLQEKMGGHYDYYRNMSLQGSRSFPVNMSSATVTFYHDQASQLWRVSVVNKYTYQVTTWLLISTWKS